MNVTRSVNLYPEVSLYPLRLPSFAHCAVSTGDGDSDGALVGHRPKSSRIGRRAAHSTGYRRESFPNTPRLFRMCSSHFAQTHAFKNIHGMCLVPTGQPRRRHPDDGTAPPRSAERQRRNRKDASRTRRHGNQQSRPLGKCSLLLFFHTSKVAHHSLIHRERQRFTGRRGATSPTSLSCCSRRAAISTSRTKYVS